MRRQVSGPASPRVAGCPGQREPTASTWPARSAAARGSPSARAPTMNTRRRRCGTPKKRESRTRQATPYPMSASVPTTVPKSRPPFEERRPGTFSTSSHRGRRDSAIRANSKKRPDRSRRGLGVVRRRRGLGRGSRRRGDQLRALLLAGQKVGAGDAHRAALHALEYRDLVGVEEVLVVHDPPPFRWCQACSQPGICSVLTGAVY
jgi:hypothetical protein